MRSDEYEPIRANTKFTITKFFNDLAVFLKEKTPVIYHDKVVTSSLVFVKM